MLGGRERKQKREIAGKEQGYRPYSLCQRISKYLEKKDKHTQSLLNAIRNLCLEYKLAPHRNDKGMTFLIPTHAHIAEIEENSMSDDNTKKYKAFSAIKDLILNDIYKKPADIGKEVLTSRGMYMEVDKVESNAVTFKNGCVIKPDKEFAKNDFGDDLVNVWIVESGKPESSGTPLRNGKSKKQNEELMGGVPEELSGYVKEFEKSVYDGGMLKRLQILKGLIRECIVNRNMCVNQKPPCPLLRSAVSLLNWLMTYRRNFYNMVVHIIDADPMATLCIFLLDNVVSDNDIFGDGKSSAPQDKYGWRCTVVIRNTLAEDWETHLKNGIVPMHGGARKTCLSGGCRAVYDAVVERYTHVPLLKDNKAIPADTFELLYTKNHAGCTLSRKLKHDIIRFLIPLEMDEIFKKSMISQDDIFALIQSLEQIASAKHPHELPLLQENFVECATCQAPKSCSILKQWQGTKDYMYVLDGSVLNSVKYQNVKSRAMKGDSVALTLSHIYINDLVNIQTSQTPQMTGGTKRCVKYEDVEEDDDSTSEVSEAPSDDESIVEFPCRDGDEPCFG